MKEWTIGETLCDMHYGLPSESEYPESIPVECRNHVSINIKDSSFNDQFLMSVGVFDSLSDVSYTNKMAIVVSIGFDGWYTAAYIYDCRKFGMFEFRSCQPVQKS